MNAGEALRRFRKKRNLTIEQLSDLSGVSKYTIGRYENGGEISLDILPVLMEALGVDISIEFHERQKHVR